jgi:hypothetical protein
LGDLLANANRAVFRRRDLDAQQGRVSDDRFLMGATNQAAVRDPKAGGCELNTLLQKRPEVAEPVEESGESNLQTSVIPFSPVTFL